MKNVHVLPTDQPSRLHKNTINEFVLCDLNFGKNTINGHNIYITSSEEIIEGDYCYDNFLKSVFKANSIMGVKTQCTSEKIILSTDPTLIADGVQKIEDEFLEWLVQNPTCEFVETQKTQHVSYETNYNGRTTPLYKGVYKIIIPQEEQKQHLINIMQYDEGLGLYEEPEKESLEEAAENYGWRIKTNTFSDPVKANDLANSAKQDFINGANYQAERMYSEEEVKEIVEKTIEKFYKHNYTLTKAKMKEQWFEQFKKK
jgi:hypothetical protein